MLRMSLKMMTNVETNYFSRMISLHCTTSQLQLALLVQLSLQFLSNDDQTLFQSEDKYGQDVFANDDQMMEQVTSRSFFSPIHPDQEMAVLMYFFGPNKCANVSLLSNDGQCLFQGGEKEDHDVAPSL